VACTSTLRLSDHGNSVEAARGLLQEYLRLPDAWERFGGVPDRLPDPLEREIEAFPGEATPPGGDVILGVTASGDVVAAGHIVRLEPIVCEFKRLYVRPEDRRNGLATQVVEAMVHRARVLGYRRAVLDVMPERASAIAFWARLGFRPCPPYRVYPFTMNFMEMDLDP
jgi:putative acetyltransferase